MKNLQSLILQTRPVVELTLKQKQKKQPPKKSTEIKKPYAKQKISAALREQVWVQQNGHVFEKKCAVTWCTNPITVFNFQCGHDIPESKGGPTNITNLYPICGKCNLSMSNSYTFQEWCKLYESKEPSPLVISVPSQAVEVPNRSSWKRVFCCFC